MTDHEYGYLTKAIQRSTGIDIGSYRSKQMRRRLETFVEKSGALNVGVFCRNLDGDPAMVKKLRDFLTINVSEFFRDETHFSSLRNIILPQLLEKSPRLSIWSAGCSNGAEIYSITMMLNDISPDAKHYLLGTDIDDAALSHAKAGGPYAPHETRNIAKWQTQKYFTVSETQSWVVSDICRRVQFKKHNLMRDHFQTGFDFIACRNVIIYFTDETKSTLFRQFHNSLKEGGILFVGGSEILTGDLVMGFSSIVPFFYKKEVGATRLSKV